jgi:predicted metal-binding protein
VKLMDRFDCMSDPDVREAIIQLLLYFTFMGSGRNTSPKPVNSMIVREKNGVIHFHRCMTDEEKRNYITSILHRIKISFRNKGIPRTQTNVHEPWIFREERPDGTVKVKGSMHLRFYC